MRVMMDKKMNRPCAFVLLENAEKANEAFREMNNLEVEKGQERLYVNFYQAKEVRKRELSKNAAIQKNETNLFIKSLLPSVTIDKLKEVFSKYGKVS